MSAARTTGCHRGASAASRAAVDPTSGAEQLLQARARPATGRADPCVSALTARGRVLLPQRAASRGGLDIRADRGGAARARAAGPTAGAVGDLGRLSRGGPARERSSSTSTGATAPRPGGGTHRTAAAAGDAGLGDLVGKADRHGRRQARAAAAGRGRRAAATRRSRGRRSGRCKRRESRERQAGADGTGLSPRRRPTRR